MGEYEEALRMGYAKAYREESYYEAALLRLIENLGPITVEVLKQSPNSPHANIRRKSFMGMLFPSVGFKHHHGQAYWNLTGGIFNIKDLLTRHHWVLFSDGELESVLYTTSNTRYPVKPLNRSRNIHSYQTGTSSTYGRTILNGYLNLRDFALLFGVPRETITDLEKGLLAPEELKRLNRALSIPISQDIRIITASDLRASIL